MFDYFYSAVEDLVISEYSHGIYTVHFVPLLQVSS